jgi:hypothetical protein
METRGYYVSLSVGSAALAFLFITADAHALKFSGGCRGARATVTEITGINSRRARVTAKHTRADAITYCEYLFYHSQPRPPGAKPSAFEVSACADKFMREEKDNTSVYRAEADCRAGTITLIFTALPTDTPEQSLNYKLPISSTCAGNGQQAVDVFRMLCPAYRGQIEMKP